MDSDHIGDNDTAALNSTLSTLTNTENEGATSADSQTTTAIEEEALGIPAEAEVVISETPSDEDVMVRVRDDFNQNVIQLVRDLYLEPDCAPSASFLKSLFHEDAQMEFLTSQFREFQVYAENQEKKRESIPESETTSIYYDALETQSTEDRGKDPGIINRQTRRRCCGPRWCCCCAKSNTDDSVPGSGDYKKNNEAGDSGTFVTAMTTEKSTSNSSTHFGLFSRSKQVSTKAVNVTSGEIGPPRPPGQARRKRVPDRPDKSISLWSVLKNALSKDISRSPLPVNFAEPLSMLQRLAEEYEYSGLLDKATKTEDQWEQLCLVAAFSVASYGNTGIRTYKPFNPLLGETYELDRMQDLGWRYISEQVSHHPPTAAIYCEGSGWVCWQDLTMTSKWHMNTCDFNPFGVTHLRFNTTGHHYTWRKVTTVVHNLIWGKLWVDQMGDATVTNQTTGDVCKLQFGRPNNKVSGTVATKSGLVKWTLKGKWDEQLVATAGTKSAGSVRILWKLKLPAPESEMYYYMSEFACQLNEMEEGVAPTDSRLRPDQRLMERGYWDEANEEKLRLETKQRQEGHQWESEEDDKKSANSGTSVAIQRKPYTPLWFRKARDEITSQPSYKYNHMYWERKKEKNWSMCPSIF